MRTHAPMTPPPMTLTPHRTGIANPSSPVISIARMATAIPTTNPPVSDAPERLIFLADSAMTMNHSAAADERATPAPGSSEVAMILRFTALTCRAE